MTVRESGQDGQAQQIARDADQLKRKADDVSEGAEKIGSGDSEEAEDFADQADELAERAGDLADQVGDVAEQVGDSAALEVVARVGLVFYGLVYLLIGWLALRLAWGLSAQESADPSGAMGVLAQQPFGNVLLWAVAAGLLALALWQVSEAIWGRRLGDNPRERLVFGSKALVYAALSVSASRDALGSRTSSSQSQQEATAGVLGLPAGRVLVVVIGLVVIAVGFAGAVKGARKAFRDEIDTSSMSDFAGACVQRLGQVGFIAQGGALAIVGALLAYATVTFKKGNTQGLDGAMLTILTEPFGKFLLTAVALGFMAYGLFALLQARYRNM